MSKIKSVKFYWKKANPFVKAKYTFVTNSEQVLWRKDEKNIVKRSWNCLPQGSRALSESVIGCLLHNERAISGD